MQSRGSSCSGSVLAIMLCVLVVVGSIGATVLSVNASRFSALEVMESRLEAARISRAMSDVMAATAMRAAATDAAVAFPSTDGLGERNWKVIDATVNSGAAFPDRLLQEARPAALTDDRDVGAPDSITWLAPASEAVTALATLRLERPNRDIGAEPFRVDLQVEATLWRIPAGAVNILISQQNPIFEFPIATDGLVVVVPSQPKHNLPYNLYSSAPDKLIFTNTSDLKITAGDDMPARVHSVYGLYPSMNPASDRDLSSPDASYAGIETVMIGTEKHFGVDLSRYNGPPALSIRGTAVTNGFVIIGAPGGGAQLPLSIAVDGPLILAGSNARYVSCATPARNVTIYSSISLGGDQWIVDDKVAATNTEWSGHLFVAAMDPEFVLPQDWSAANFTLVGSLHLLGGHITQGGAGAMTLSLLNIRTPRFDRMADNPFSTACRQEGFAVWSLK